MALSVLIVAWAKYPRTEVLDIKKENASHTFPKKFFILYLIALSLIAAGFADYPLIVFHFNKTRQVSADMIPVLYAIAMGVDALTALLPGTLFDRYGMKVLIGSTLVSLLFVPLVFAGNFYTAVAGMVCWGIGMAAQESVVRAVLASVLPQEKKGTGFGVFNAVFGLFWFLGSFLMGWLYDVSVTGLIIFSMLAQLASIPFFASLKGKVKV